MSLPTSDAASDNLAARVVVRPFPVLYACQGCPEFGQAARDVGMILDRRGFAQMIWLGSAREDSRPTQRFPIFALDGCARECARRWLTERSAAPQRSYVFAEYDRGGAERAAQRILAEP